MPKNYSPSKRQLLRSIHTWVGIIAGAFISIIALAGSVGVFRNEFEQAKYPRATSAGSFNFVSLDDVAHAVTQFRPEAHIRRVRLPRETGAAYVFQIESDDKRTERVIADASSGRVVGTQEPGWVDWMVDLHRNLLLGKPGRATVGVIGIVLFLLSATGILMWLIGARNWRAWISVPKGGSATRFNYELHRLGGLWAYVFLAMISFTGVGLAFPDAFKQAVQAIMGPSTLVRAPKKTKAELLRPLDEYLQAAHAAMPDAEPTEIRLPEPGQGPVELRLHRAGDLAPASNRVYLNPSSTAVVAVERLSDQPFGARFLASLAPLHYGEFGGVPIKVAWSLLALTPVLLFVTGLIAWWQRAKRKRSMPVSKKADVKPLILAGR